MKETAIAEMRCKLTWSLPHALAAGDPCDFFVLFGNQVRIDVVRQK